MGRWRRVRDWWMGETPPGHKFSESPPRPIDQVIMDMMGRGVTPRVTRAEALSVPAVQRGRNMLCSIATLPLEQIGPKRERVRNALLEQIDPDVPNVVTLAQTIEDLLFDAISWWQITGYGHDLYPVTARHLDVATVSLDPPSGRSPAPLPSGIDPHEHVVYVDGKVVPARDMIRFDSPNPGVLHVGGRAIKRALLLDLAAAMYSDDPRPLDYFTPAEGADPVDDDEVETILAKWKAARKRRSTAWVPQAMKYNAVDSPSPADLQLVELQKQASLDIANALGIDPEDLGVSTTSRTYSNAIDRRRDRINDVLSPFMRAITDRLSMGDVTRRGYRVAFDLDDYMKSNPTERWATYKTAKEIGVLDRDEIREKEELPERAPATAPAPVPPAPVDDPTADPAADPTAPPAADPPVNAAELAPSMAFSEDGKLHFADIPMRSFSVNTATRTIEGLALPYGVVGTKYGMKFRFLKNSLKWNSAAPTRVKLLRDHDMGQPLGYAKTLTDTAAGLKVAFKVASGAEGDKALALAADGVLDGLSVGVDFDVIADTEMDPNDDTVMLVRRADLREVSLTAMPLFDDARVSSVAASRNEGRGTMDPCATCGQQHAPGVACPTTEPATQQNAEPQGLQLNQDQLTTLLSRPGALQALVQPAAPAAPATPVGGLTFSAEQVDALIRSGAIGAILGVPQMGPVQQQPAGQEPEKRATVNPVRRTTASTTVDESAPYRFDRKGNLTKGKFDFSTDLIAGFQGDGEAFERAQGFMRAHFEKRETRRIEAVNQADAATLNPNIQRPDLYVDQQEFEYPIWNAISKGTIADATPFVLPKFNTSSGLVAAHVENTEPTPGTFTATAQTITPSAVSGKVEISREAWDQGGNPQLSGLIWRQMERAWFEALEASAVTLLNSLAATFDITITALAQDAALEASLTSQLAPLQYVRGGFRMRDFFIQVDLYKALIAAKDTAGRKLFPVLGATNATGTSAEFFSALLVAGLVGRPAWALAATGIVAANSYLFDRGDVSGWATAPQRLTFENISVAKVHVGIWGYKALANTDLTGVRRLIYDPA